MAKNVEKIKNFLVPNSKRQRLDPALQQHCGMKQMGSSTVSREQPYLETISSGSTVAFNSFPLHRKLLCQPITIPDLGHLGIDRPVIAGGGPKINMKEKYVNYNGSVTNNLRNLIRRVPGALRTDFRKASREAQAKRFYNRPQQQHGQQSNRRPSSCESLTPSEASRLEHEFEERDEGYATEDSTGFYETNEEGQNESGAGR